MLGSDYPFDMGDPDPVATLEACIGLTLPERDAILGRTAASVFGFASAGEHTTST